MLRARVVTQCAWSLSIINCFPCEIIRIPGQHGTKRLDHLCIPYPHCTIAACGIQYAFPALPSTSPLDNVDTGRVAAKNVFQPSSRGRPDAYRTILVRRSEARCSGISDPSLSITCAIRRDNRGLTCARAPKRARSPTLSGLSSRRLSVFLSWGPIVSHVRRAHRLRACAR